MCARDVAKQPLTMRLLLFLGLLATASALNATACASTYCNDQGSCLDLSSPSSGCLCNATYYGAFCNQTALQCALSRCNGGKGTCVQSSATACVCGLAGYDGTSGCSVCLSGFDLATNCTTCAEGFFGPQCSTTALACGTDECSSHGYCNGSGLNVTGCVCLSSLYTGPRCERQLCGPHGAPGGCDSGCVADCVCDLNYASNGTYCLVDCGAHGYRLNDTACNCTDFYVGAFCETPPIDCGAFGVASSHTTCVCSGNYTGAQCETPPIDCGAHGLRVAPQACVCLDFYTGSRCEASPASCNYGTRVITSECVCEELYGGPYCNITLIQCGAHGSRLNETVCECRDGFEGATCDLAPLVREDSGLDTTTSVVIGVGSFVCVVAAAAAFLVWRDARTKGYVRLENKEE
jgi:hypothetical protein